MKKSSYFKRAVSAVLLLLLSLGLAAPALAASADPVVLLTGRYDSPAYPGRELSYQFPYSDAYFTKTGELYDHQLAQCSLGLAVSAFRSADQTIDHKDEYAKAYLSEAGFGDFVSHQFDEIPTAETIATIIGSKAMRDEEGEFLMVAAGVSGGGYEDEWLSNFSFGDATVHDGFFSAAFTVFERVFDYAQSRADGRRVKLWISGYSRAAAVSNMVAVLALETGQIANKDLYAYTFATPNNVQTDSNDFSMDRTYDFSNIFNIVGMFDPVPSIPFQEWGYGKLGTTFHLPAQETTPDYMRRRKRVEEIYREITGEEYTNNLEVNWFIQKLYQLIYDMVRTADSYQTQLEGVIDTAWESKSSTLRLLRALCGVLSSDREMDDMLLGEAPTANTLLSVFLYDLAMEKLGLHPDKWNDLNLMIQLFYEHCPEVYIAWMMSQDDPGELFVFDLDYRRIFLDGGMSWTLRDEDGNLMDAAGVDALGRTVMLTVPSDRTYVLTLSGGSHATERIRAVEYSAGSLHYAYKLYEIEGRGGSPYTLTLPDEYWSQESIGGMTDAAGNAVSPKAQALDRANVHPSAVFELEDCGFWASHFLDLIVVLLVVLVLVTVSLPIAAALVLRRRRKKKSASPQSGGAS